MEAVKLKSTTITLAVLTVFLFQISCEEPFEPASLITKRRFIAIVPDPVEAAPGEKITFTAVVTNEDGSDYDGPIGWAVVGSNSLRLGESFDISQVEDYSVVAALESFVWQVPEKEELESRFGQMQANGMLLTVAASAFGDGNVFQGQVLGGAIPAFKLFVVSERAPEDRMTNPAIESISIFEPSGDEVEVDEDGEYSTDSSKVTMKAKPDQPGNRLSFHWYSIEKDFDPDYEAAQIFDPDSVGLYPVYCVIRRAYYFDHDDGSRTMISGINWEKINIRFK